MSSIYQGHRMIGLLNMVNGTCLGELPDIISHTQQLKNVGRVIVKRHGYSNHTVDLVSSVCLFIFQPKAKNIVTIMMRCFDTSELQPWYLSICLSGESQASWEYPWEAWQSLEDCLDQSWELMAGASVYVVYSLFQSTNVYLAAYMCKAQCYRDQKH